jgi:hypothetical protein
MTKAAGWRGAAIWLASQVAGDGKDGQMMDDKDLEKYWRTRARWTRQAGVEYWKVDYGARGGKSEFRKMLTQIAAEEAPGLIVEHGRGSGPLNDEECPWDTPNYNRKGSYRTWGDGEVLEQAVTLARFSRILRTYDVTAYLSVPTTLDRVAQILAEFPDFQYDPSKFRRRIDEVARAVRWHRIAPAFPLGQTKVLLDKDVLIDTWRFRHGDSWATWMDGRETLQTAPARVARGLPLPQVDSGRGPAPYVIASRNPNGAVSVATLPRISTGKGIYFPLVDVSIEIADATAPVGIFGRYRSLTLNLTEDLGKCSILAQDLAGDRAVDITNQVELQGKKIIVPGSLIGQVGLSAATPNDLSEPAIVLVIKK